MMGTVLVVLAVLAGCMSAGGAPAARSDQVIKPGRGVFTFDGYAPLKDRPLQVWYDAPADPATAQILVVLHGVGRNADEYAADWHEQVQAHNVLVIAPEFSDEAFPGSAAYNLGNTVDEDGNPRPPEEWSFALVEALFDFVVRDTGNPAPDYALFGHSAGAQFVHRFLEFVPENRARIAVAANAGWYTTLDDTVAFPYGLKGAPLTDGVLRRAVGSNLVVLLGADDIEQDDDALRRGDAVDAQGTTRLDRGLHFFRTARLLAAEEGAPFRWRLLVVPGIAHSHQDMAVVAAPLLTEVAARN